VTELTPIWERINCSICGEPFQDEVAWDVRHEDEYSRDCHEECGPTCPGP
jgi:hypothetical protein